jgi:L-ascorbate oxidase
MNVHIGRLLILLGCLALTNSGFATRHGTTHDKSWEPEYVLIATAQNITTNCQSRYSVVFNGTSPGPAIHMREGKTTWVRVYNQIDDQNVTVVGRGPPSVNRE